ncbi:hypothetical protein NC797_06890 [Aquibacillus sp. 3ASR75-11]|uniref:Uncharacterized protein n=1 Tax=Terrihalobacillus insolitus TaxID=2950438 RepID=A0A9X3WT92_9BACI|nr:hypothetical protein [Terrihalobacillus insolitus]MDC3424233.1 hypothetical protein [Terrihalobacillus insolitus]
MNRTSQQLEARKKNEKIEMVLNHSVEGEAFILSPGWEWKKIVLNYFNRVQQKDLTVEKLLQILKSKGVVFGQKDTLVQYPVIKCLEYIAKISNQEIELNIGDGK